MFSFKGGHTLDWSLETIPLQLVFQNVSNKQTRKGAENREMQIDVQSWKLKMLENRALPHSQSSNSLGLRY